MFLFFCLKQLEIIKNGMISCSLLGTFYNKIFLKKNVTISYIYV